MANPLDGQRRVVLVAYVGRDYASFLPDPKDIEIVCSPTPGATRAEAVAGLQSAGAKIQFSDNLHMKVYWAQNRGCLITSANLSQNALGISGLHEAGALVGADDVNIDAFVKSAEPYDVNDKNLRRLAERERKFDRANPEIEPDKRDYNQWYSVSVAARDPWKLGCWWEECETAKSVKQFVRTIYNKPDVSDFINVAKGQAKKDDWLLCFYLSKTGKPSKLGWMSVDHVIEVARSAFVETVTDLNTGRAGWPAELERARLWYEPNLDRIHEDSGTRHADLIQLEQIANGYPSRERFLTELTLDPPDATSDQAGMPLLDEDYLILSTIHSAKGQEWKSVFVLNVVDGCIPSDLGTGTSAEIKEERRLLYVAMTRAKDDLHLIVPQRFFTHGQNAQGDRHVYASRTRFIADGLLGLFERTTWPMAAPGPAVRPASEGVRVDIGARMRGMWR